MKNKLNLTPYREPKPYLTPTDPDAFKDMEIRSPEGSYIKDPVFCPVCQGYGGWNLRLDAYGPGVHFKSHCFQCNGYGFVSAESKSATCVHVWTEKTVGRCLHEYTCKCGEKRIVDSSD